MLARTWRGATKAAQGDGYLEYLRKTGLAEYRGTVGNRGVIGLRRVVGDKAEFLLVSLWESPEAIEQFAGPTPDRAVFYPEDDRFLVARDETVDHFEVVFADLAPRRSWVGRLWDWWVASWRATYGPNQVARWKIAAFR